MSFKKKNLPDVPEKPPSLSVSKAANRSSFRSLIGSRNSVSFADADSTDPLSLAEDVRGFHVLKDGAPPVTCDIVAVHGLAGHPYKTWSHGSGHLWLRDSLPDELTHARVMTFGYDASVFSRSIADVRNTATALLAELNTLRKGVEGRPIMFICHSLGGIVFKQALNHAHSNLPDDKYQDILDNAKAVAFLGTPHGGADAAWWSRMATRIIGTLSGYQAPISDRFLECLQKGSKELSAISEDFVQRSRPPFIIKSFFETKATSKGPASTVIVDRQSAKIGVANEEAIPVETDHISICKAPSRDSYEFRVVARMIINVVDGITKAANDQPDSTSTPEQFDNIVKLLRLKNDIAIQGSMKWLEGTCTWILEHPRYNQWQESRTSSMFWISSPPGHGKTVLASYLWDRHLQRRKYCELAVCYFFCGSSTEDQKSPVTVLRTILGQLLKANKHLIRHVFPMYKTQGANMAEDLQILWSLCTTCFEDANIIETVIFIDALDECSLCYRTELMLWTQKVFKSRNDQKLPSLKVIVTSRSETGLPSQLEATTTLLDLDHEPEAIHQMGRDINRFIDINVKELAKSRRNLDQRTKVWLVESLRNEPGKTFQWITSVLQQLRNLTSLTRASIRALLEDLPTEMSHLYHELLTRVNKHDRNTSKFLLRLITAAKRPLSVSELNWAKVIFLTRGNMEEAQDHLESNFADTIRKLCVNMVDISNEKVTIKQRHFKEFLLSDSKDLDGAKQWYHFTNLEAQVNITESCIWRVRSLKRKTSELPTTPGIVRSFLDYDVTTNDEVEKNRTFFRKLNAQNPFFQYALNFLAEHFADIELHASVELISNMRSLYSNEDAFTLWCRGYWNEREEAHDAEMKTLHLEIPSLLREPIVKRTAKSTLTEATFEYSASPERMMSRNGHVRIFRGILEADSAACWRSFADSWTALNTAIDMKQTDLVKYVIDHGAEVNAPALGFAPIHRAVCTGNKELIHLLLDKNAEVNIQDSHGMTSIHLVALSDPKEAISDRMAILRLLLGRKAQMDIADKDGDTPLHKAAAQGHLEMVKLLVETGSNVRMRNCMGAMPLLKAIETRGKRVPMVRFLLDHMATEDFQIPNNAFLHAAVRENDAAVVKLLLEAGAEVETLDVKGETAFSQIAVSERYDKSIHELLLGKGAKFNAQDRHGVTLLHGLAAENELATIRKLLHNGADINSCTKEGDTVLHYAVSRRGGEDVFQFLLDNGANINARNKLGETPLHKAVGSWRSARTIDLLIKRGAKLELRSWNAQTPLHIAVQNQNAGLTRFLLSKGARSDISTIEGYGLFHLAEISFEYLFASYRRANIQKREYEKYWPFAHDGKQAQDDGPMHEFKGSLEQAAIMKIDKIKDALTTFGAKEDPPSPVKPKRRSSISKVEGL